MNKTRKKGLGFVLHHCVLPYVLDGFNNFLFFLRRLLANSIKFHGPLIDACASSLTLTRMLWHRSNLQVKY